MAKLLPEPSEDKFGWKVKEWAHAVGVSRSYTYELLAEGRITSVKVGAARIITTHPRDFLSAALERVQ
jgi:excisionase family DNA binding protein